jgi:hypothetical protein
MEIEELFGLPAHPLLVHAAVVLVPLAALGAVLVAAVPKTRRSYAPLVLIIAIAALVSVGLAQGSGEEFEDQVVETELTEEHTDQGETVLPWAVAVVVVAGAVTGAAAFRRRVPKVSAGALTAGLVVAAVVASAGATWTVIDVGHSGAEATWDDLPAPEDADHES